MPIRINLKEVFTADSQDIVINKVNFNFNKLLELGIGEDGPIGITGPEGPAGPIGLTGDPGTPGNIWYADTETDPNNTSFPDVNEGDFYLDTAGFTIWRYNGTIWIQQADITQIINDYLSTVGSVFTRGFGNGTADSNFIVFNNRGQDATRRLNDNNDILFLNNFNETYLNTTYPAFTLNANAFFNSLLSISVDRSNVTPYRNHIELGVLYGDNAGTPEGHTSTNESFKVKYERIDTSVLSYGHYNIATLSMDLPETVSSGRVTNGVFNFVSPKKYTSIDSNSNVYIGSQYGLDEVYGFANTIKADGLLFYQQVDQLVVNVGIAQDFLIPNFPANTGYVSNLATNAYFMIDAINNTTNGTYINDPLYQTGGNLIQLGNTTPRNVYSNTSTITFPFVPTYKRGGITAVGNTLFTIRGESGTGSTPLTPLVDDIGWFNRFNIEDPNTPRLTMNIYADGQTYGTTRLIGANASDIAASGNYVYIVNDQNILNTTINGSNKRTYFQILSPNSVDSNYTRISTLGTNSMFGSSSLVGNDPEELNSAYKVKIKGGYALVATNALHSLGNNWHGRQFLGQYETSVAGEKYDGYLTSIDVTNPAIPKIKSSATNTKETITDWAVNNGGNSYIQKSAILDFDISSDYAYALTWEQTVSDLATTAKIYVKIVAFDISNPNSIAYHGKSDSSSNGTFIDGYYTDLQIDQLVTVGAIASNDQYIYAGYGNMIKVFRTYDKTGSYIFPVASTYTIPGTVSSQFITDIKQFGNSLYAIVNLSPSSAPYTKIYKFNINDSTLTKVWEKEIVGSSGTSIATHFVIIGKHIYCSVHNLAPNNTGLPILITIDYDGIYTSGAHIESLRSDIVSITHDLTVGGHTQLDSSLTVAGPAGIHGELSVSSNARINGELHVTNYGSTTSAIEVGAGRTANGYAYLDLIGDTTYPDYGVRLIRNATGANTTSELIHNGTGNLEIITNQSATVAFKMGSPSTMKAKIDTEGIKLISGSAGSPSYSFINDDDTGMYSISDGNLGFSVNYFLKAKLDGYGLKLIDGTASAPSYSFINDADTGMYSISDGTLGFTVNAQYKASIDTVGIKLVDGSITDPAYSFYSDTGTGFYRSGAGTIGVATLDTRTALFDTDGIKLENGAVSVPSYSFFNDSDTGFYRDGEGSIGISTNGSLAAKVDGTGIKLLNGSAASPAYSFIGDGSTGMYLIASNELGIVAGSVSISDAGGTNIRLSTLGNDSSIEVGKGRTDSGYAYLDLIGDTTYYDYGLRLIRNDTGANTTSELVHSGTGNLEIITNQSATIAFKMGSLRTMKAQIDTEGIKLINGSAGSPSYSFINDPDSGMYLIADGVIGFAVNYYFKASLDGNGIKLIDGTSSEPSYSFYNDQNTGFYRIDEGSIGISSNGLLKAKVDGIGIKLENGSEVSPSYSFINDPDSGLYLMTDGTVGFAANGEYKASVDGYGFKYIDGSFAHPTLSFNNDTDTGLFRVGEGAIGFTSSGTHRATIKATGLFIYSDGEMLNLRGTTHSYIALYSKGNLANPGNLNTRSAYIGFGHPLDDDFDIVNERLGNYVSLDRSGNVNIHSETTTGSNIDVAIKHTVDIAGNGNVLYLYSNENNYTDVGMGMLRKRDALAWASGMVTAGNNLCAVITTGGTVYPDEQFVRFEPDMEPPFTGGTFYYRKQIIDDRNLTIKHQESGYINLLNTPVTYVEGIEYDVVVGPGGPAWIGASPTQPGVHTRFADAPGTTEYANINTNGLNINNTLKFKEATYSIKSADNDTVFSGNNSGLSAWKLASVAGLVNTADSVFTHHFMNLYTDLTAYFPSKSGADSFNFTIDPRTYDLQVNAVIVSGLATAYVQIDLLRPGFVPESDGWITIARGTGGNSTTAIIPAGYRWRLLHYVTANNTLQINITVYKLGMQTI